MKRFFLTILMWVYAPLRGKATRMPADPQHVLVVQMAKLGDMVCTTPVFHAIKGRYPNARVTVMGSEINQAVLEGNTDVDDYIVFGGIRAAARLLREKKFDAVLLAGAPDLASLVTSYWAGVPLIVAPWVEEGECPAQDVWYRLAAKMAYTVPHTMGQYAPREYLHLLEPLGIVSEDTTKHLVYSLQAKEDAEKFFQDISKPIVGISPGAGNKVKEWPAERFASIADTLIEKYRATVLVFGSARDRAEVDAMLAHVKNKEHVIDLSEKLSIDELKAYIAKLNLFVAVDTGPIYIAEAFGAPTVDIVGPMDEHEQPPQGSRHIVVVPPGQRIPQLHIMNAHPRDPEEAIQQAQSITVAQVLDACEKLVL